MLKSNTLKVNREGSLCFITFPKFEKYKLRHAFTTRLGGVSEGIYRSMNLSFNVGDDREKVIKNYEIICNAIGIDTEDITLTKQTHTNNVIAVTEKNRGSGIYRPSDYDDVDGIITDCKNVAIVGHSADCCLIGFFDPVSQVIAVSHAGWRGTAAEIGRVTVQKMQKDFGCNPKDILVGLCPSISKCCYEVDTPVYNEFAKIDHLDTDSVFTKKQGDKYMLDLYEANRQILVHCGIKNENIDISDICTNCNGDDLHSHRASKGKRGVNGLIMEL